MSALLTKIRGARMSDIDAVFALERATQGAPHWTRAVYAEMLGAHRVEGLQRRLLVAEVEAPLTPGTPELGLAGFAVVSFLLGSTNGVADGVAQLESIAVSSACRRAGIGRALCLAALEWCRGLCASELLLEVRAGSTAALAFYRSLGFIETGRRAGYYSDPQDDALLLRFDMS